MVQPGVSALGYHHSSTYPLVKSSSFTGIPSWLGRAKNGAVPPVSIKAIWVPPRVRGLCRRGQSSMKRGEKKHLLIRPRERTPIFLVIPRIARILKT